MKAAIAEILRVVIGVAIPLAAFTTGLVAPKAAVAAPLWKQPSLLVRSLVAIFVLVPLWAFALLSLLPVDRVVRVGVMIAILAVGIGPASSMKRMHGTTPAVRYAFELNVAVLLLAIVLVPADVAAIAWLSHREVHFSVGQVARVVLGRALVPLALGLCTARFLPKLGEPLGRWLPRIESVVFLLVVVLALAASWRDLLGVGAVGWLACVAAVLGALAIGHGVGGPDDGTRSGLAAASAMRFPALALVLVSSVAPHDKRLISVVVAYVLAAVVLVGLYGAVMARRARRAGEGPAPTPIAAAPARRRAPATSG